MSGRVPAFRSMPACLSSGMDIAKPFHRRAFQKPSHHARRPARAQGFSLLEVLISIVILSFGVLGMVGLQATALQSNRDARLQSTASSLARELAEIMRSDKYAFYDANSNPYLQDFTAPLTPVTASHCLDIGSTQPCGNHSEIANALMTEWLARVSAELPGARVNVCVDRVPFDANGLPRWNCTPGADAVTFIKIGWTRGSVNRAASASEPLDRASLPSIVFPVTPGID